MAIMTDRSARPGQPVDVIRPRLLQCLGGPVDDVRFASLGILHWSVPFAFVPMHVLPPGRYQKTGFAHQGHQEHDLELISEGLIPCMDPNGDGSLRLHHRIRK